MFQRPPKHWMQDSERLTTSFPRESSMNQQAAPRFMTVAEVAEIMRVSKMTVYRLIHSGEMPAIRVGKSFRVPEAAVSQLLGLGITDHIDVKPAASNG